MKPAIYSKTAKGIAEVETKANGLSRLERSVLIYIDGKRTSEEIKQLPRVSDQLTNILHTLETGGYIQLITPSHPTPAPPPTLATATTTPHDAASAGIFRPLPATFEPETFAMAKNFMINTLNFFKGQYGATALVRNIDHCRTHEELRSYFEAWHTAITSTTQGQKRERELREKLLAVL